MTQVYPGVPVTKAMLALADEGSPRPIPPEINPGIMTLIGPAYEPDTWAEKATNHPQSTPTLTNLSPARTDPDFVLITPVNKASNMPY